MVSHGGLSIYQYLDGTGAPGAPDSEILPDLLFTYV